MAYPTSLDNIAANKQDDTDARTGADLGTSSSVGDHAAHHNALATAINAIENELGLNPSGTQSTVKDRLDTLVTSDALGAATNLLLPAPSVATEGYLNRAANGTLSWTPATGIDQTALDAAVGSRVAAPDVDSEGFLYQSQTGSITWRTIDIPSNVDATDLGDLGASQALSAIIGDYKVFNGSLSANCAITLTMATGSTIELRLYQKGAFTLTINGSSVSVPGVEGTLIRVVLYPIGVDLAYVVQSQQGTVISVGGEAPSELVIASGSGAPGTLSANTVYFSTGTTPNEAYLEPGTSVFVSASRDSGLITNQVHYFTGAAGPKVLTFQPGAKVTTQLVGAAAPTSMPDNSFIIQVDKSGIETGLWWGGDF